MPNVLNRGDFQTLIINEVAQSRLKIINNLPSNGVRRITAADHRDVSDTYVDALNELSITIKDSYFNLLSDTTNHINEGNNPEKWFFSEAHFIWRLENQATTDNLSEGTANLYYTDARVDNRINTLRPVAGQITNLAITAAANYNQSQLQAVSAKVDAILAALRSSNTIAS